jgi:hypothetical protein
MEFWKAFCLLCIKGLTRITYNRPKSARKLLGTLFGFCVFAQVGLLIYQRGYKNGQTHISNEFTKNLSRPGLAKAKKKYLENYMIATRRESTSQIDNLVERHNLYIDIAEAILVVIILLYTNVDNSEQSDP